MGKKLGTSARPAKRAQKESLQRGARVVAASEGGTHVCVCLCVVCVRVQDAREISLCSCWGSWAGRAEQKRAVAGLAFAEAAGGVSRLQKCFHLWATAPGTVPRRRLTNCEERGVAESRTRRARAERRE